MVNRSNVLQRAAGLDVEQALVLLYALKQHEGNATTELTAKTLFEKYTLESLTHVEKVLENLSSVGWLYNVVYAVNGFGRLTGLPCPVVVSSSAKPVYAIFTDLARPLREIFNGRCDVDTSAWVF